MRTIILLAAVAALGSCIPMRVSTRCQKIASDCMANCPDTRMPVQNEHTIGTGFDNDSRNSCEKSCHDVAHSCETQ